jgi:hypothetical protein
MFETALQHRVQGDLADIGRVELIDTLRHAVLLDQRLFL